MELSRASRMKADISKSSTHMSRPVVSVDMAAATGACVALLVMGGVIGYDLELMPAICLVGGLSIAIGLMFSYMRGVVSRLIGYEKKHIRRSHGETLKDVVSDVLPVTAILLLAEVIMKRYVPWTYVNKEDDRGNLVIEIGVRMLVYSRIFSAVPEESRGVRRVMVVVGMMALATVLSFRTFRDVNLSTCKSLNSNKTTIGSMIWSTSAKKWDRGEFDERCGSLFDFMEDVFMPHVQEKLFGQNEPLCRKIVFAKISSHEILWDNPNGIIVVPRRGLSPTSPKEGEELRKELVSILSSIVIGVLYLRDNLLAMNPVVKSLLPPVMGLILLSIIRSASRFINGPHVDKTSRMGRFLVFAKYLVVYFVVALVLAMISYTILYMLYTHSMSRMDKLRKDEMVKIFGKRKTEKSPIEEFIGSMNQTHQPVNE